MTTKSIETPYYSIQYILREFSKGLGTKSLSGKKIDDACKNTEINPYHLESLKKELIHDPLSKYVNIYFADHILAKFEHISDVYFTLMKNLPLDGVNIDSAHKLISQYFMTAAVTVMCSEMLEAMELTPQHVAQSGHTLMSITLETLNTCPEWSTFLADSTEPQKERIRIWSSTTEPELPDITSIASVGEAWKPGNSWGTTKSRLFIARIWDYFFCRSGYTDLNLIQENTPVKILSMLAEKLFNLQKKDADKYSPASPIMGELYELLRLREKKSQQNKLRCSIILNQLKKYYHCINFPEETIYCYHWMYARYLLHSGKLTESIEEYKSAFEYVIYRETKNTQEIIREAMIAACRCKNPDKTFINRLRRMAVILNIDIMPPLHSNDTFKEKPQDIELWEKPQDIELWEIQAFCRCFDSFYNQSSFFPDSVYPENPYTLTVSYTERNAEFQVNLKKPNSVFMEVLPEGLKKKIPQIVYFSWKGDTESVLSLLKSGADVNKLSSANESAILMAVQSMQVNEPSLGSMNDNIFWILSKIYHKKSVLDTLTHKKKLSPLGCAVQTGRIDIVRTLLDMKASVDLRHDINGDTPLYTVLGLIARHLRSDNVKFTKNTTYTDAQLQAVRAYASDVMPHDLTQMKNILSAQDCAPRYIEIQNNIKKTYDSNIIDNSSVDELREIAKLLIERGANSGKKHDHGMIRYTPLMLAAELDEVELVASMLKSEHHKINLNDTCIDSVSQKRVNIRQIIEYWQSDRVKKLLGDALP